MREILDRLREACSALDLRLEEVYFEPDTPGRTWMLSKLWGAKQSLWHTHMDVLSAAAGVGGPEED